MQIRIREYTFQLSEPFREGVPLSAAEAQALNGLRAENIRNNFARAVQREIALAEGALLDPVVVSRLQGDLDDYASRYQFVLKHTPQVRQSAIQAEAETLARETVLTARRAAGDELEGPAVEAEVAMLVQTPNVLRLARDRVAGRQALASSAMEELL